MGFKLKDREAKTEELKKAFKVDGNGIPLNFHWKGDQAQEFIDYVIDESEGLLNKFRVEPMSGPTKEIAKIIDDGKFLKPGGSYKRTGGTSGHDGYQFGNDKINLVSKDIEGKFLLLDKEIEDNIEGKEIEDHLKEICAKKIANEIVEAAIYSRALQHPNGENGILNVFNGLKYSIKLNGNVLDATDSNIFSSREISRKHLIKAKKVLKTKYRKGVEVFMDSDIKTDLDELYNDPNGNRGDGEISKNRISGMPIHEVPLMSSENPVIDETVTTTTSGVNQASQKEINVTSNISSSLSAGDTIVVRYGEADELSYTVNAVTSSKITVVENLIYDLPAGSTIHKANLNGADIIISNPKNIIVGIQRDINIELERRAPDGYNVWYTARMDIQIENPEACVLIENLKSKDA